jgi:transposase
MKTSRYVTIVSGSKEWIGKRVQVSNLPQGTYEVTFPKLTKPCYLTILALPGYKNPIRVLSNESNPKIVEQYLKRWEIERIFRSGKQEFELEKIGTLSKRKIDNLIAIVQLCIGISVHIYGRIEQEGGIKNEQTK